MGFVKSLKFLTESGYHKSYKMLERKKWKTKPISNNIFMQKLGDKFIRTIQKCFVEGISENLIKQRKILY